MQPYSCKCRKTMSDDNSNDRIETIDRKPGVDTTTIREGDVLKLVSGEPGSEGACYRVVDNSHMDSFLGEGGALSVECINPEEERGCPRDSIADNGSGPMFEPVAEADE